MIEWLGQLGLAGALLAAAATILSAAIAVRSGRAPRAAYWLVASQAVLLTVSVVALVIALLGNDFRFEYVAGYTERALPAGFRVAALWAGQEGSLLLWAWLIAVMCTLAAFGWRHRVGTDHAVTLAVMGAVAGFFAALLLFAANPFTLVGGPIPLDGRGLNPMLQNPAMIIHPPLLLVGYAGFTIPYAVMIGVLVAGRTDNKWLARIRRWLLVSWMFLGAGILLGAWWAYVELGWGGYWAWDPVENASLLPWLTSTALIHSMMAQQHRGMFKRFNVSLIAATFALCIFGTYLTRSGVIESVHAFADSPLANFFQVFLLIIVGGSIMLILRRARALRPEHRLQGLISREGAFLFANVLLVIMTIVILVGTIFPLLSGVLLDEPVTVKAPFYNRVLAPIALVLVGLMTLGPVLEYGRHAARRIGRRLIAPASGAAGAVVIVAATVTTNPWALVCTALTTLGTFTVLADFVMVSAARRRNTGESGLVAGMQMINRDHRRYGGQLAHLGLMMIVVGVAGSSLFSHEVIHRLQVGETVETTRYSITLDGVEEIRGANYTAVRAVVTLAGSGEAIEFGPERRFYDSWPDEASSEVAIDSGFRQDTYLSLAGWEADGSIAAVQVRINPMVLWIWCGGLVMTAGALFGTLPTLAAARATRPVVPASHLVAEVEP